MRRIRSSNVVAGGRFAGSRLRQVTSMALMLALSVAGACKREADTTPPAETSAAEPAAPATPSTPAPNETPARPPSEPTPTIPGDADAELAALAEFTIPEIDTANLSALIRTEIAGAQAAARSAPTTAAAIAHLGTLCYVHASPQAAVKCFTRAADLDPTADRWQFFAALAQTKAGDRQAALSTYEKLLARNPEATLAKVKIAEIASSTDRARAISLYEEALQAGMDAPFAHFGLAQCLREAGRPEEAIEHLRRAVELAPRFAEAHGALAALLGKKGLAEEAGLHQREQAMNSRLLPPMDIYELDILIKGRDPEAAAHQAFALARAGNSRRALSLAERALQIDRHARLARHALALVHLLEDRFEEAAAGLRELLQEDPGDVWAKSDLGEALARLQQLDEAERLLNEVRAAYPHEPLTLRRLARVLAIRGDFERAVALLREAVQLAPRSADVHFDLARMLREQGDRSAAIEEVRAGLELAPKSAMARHMLAVFLHEEGESQAAVTELLRCGEESPGYPDTYQLLAVIALENKDYAGGERILRGGLQQAPNSIALQNALAWILATSPVSAQRNGDEALALALAVCDRTQHRMFSLLDTLAAAYAAAGEFDKAVETQKEAIRLAEEAKHPEDDLQGYRERLQLFEIRRPYRQAP